MDANSLVRIGFSLRTHGVKGQIRITLDENIRVLSKSEVLFFLLREKHIPYFIQEIEYLDNGDAFVLLEDVNTKEQAAALAKKHLFGPADYQEQDFPDLETSHPLVGYFVLDKNLGDIGKILAITPMADYVLAHIEYQGRELLLPLHPDIIRKTNRQKKTLLIEAPEGILDV